MQAQANILILGETGVGKSTFVNAFANYISYTNLQDALSAQSKLVSLIPMAFTHVDPDTFESKQIKFGPMDPNERHGDQAGMSATQSCRTYTFEVGSGMAVSLIDTPGVGDTLGVEKDEQNFENVLNYLQHYVTEIHGIFVLLRANTPRLTGSFKYCIKELLRRLHRSACQNIVFVFTNARASGYTPGESVGVVKTFLADLPHAEIQFHKNTVYSLDNEAFRFLLASKQGVVFSAEDEHSYSGSWDRAVKECERLLQHVLQLPPHRVKETVSLNRANDVVNKLQQPLQDVLAANHKNLASCMQDLQAVQEFQGDISDLSSRLFFRRFEVEVIQLPTARTVCASQDCCRTYDVNGATQVHYKQICHDPCSMSEFSKLLFGTSVVRFCKCIQLWSGKCNECGCSYDMHQRITYQTKMVPKRVLYNNAQGQIQAKRNEEERREARIAELSLECKELQEEQDEIAEACATFAYFFETNSITPYYSDTREYVEKLIEALEETNARTDPTKLDALRKFLSRYEEKEAKLKQLARTRAPGYRIGPEQIVELANQLYSLKQSGKDIRTLVEAASQCEARTEFHEKKWEQPHDSLPSHFRTMLQDALLATRARFRK